ATRPRGVLAEGAAPPPLPVLSRVVFMGIPRTSWILAGTDSEARSIYRRKKTVHESAAWNCCATCGPERPHAAVTGGRGQTHRGSGIPAAGRGPGRGGPPVAYGNNLRPLATGAESRPPPNQR